MLCLSCTLPSRDPLCDQCRLDLAPAREVVVAPGLVGVAGYLHAGTARRLVHTLKYRAVAAAAEPLADAMTAGLPASAEALVPIPRASLRAFRYGIDPAAVLARAVGRRTGLPIVDALEPRLWWRRHAGRRRADRSKITFVGTETAVPNYVVLVDDVLTTGATVVAARDALQGRPSLALVATRASRVGAGDGSSGGAVTVQPSGGSVNRTTLRARTIIRDAATRSAIPLGSHRRDGREHA